MMKKVLMGVGVIALAIFTAPYWASCSINGDICNASCEIRHIGSDMKKAACKAGCAAERVSCSASSL